MPSEPSSPKRSRARAADLGLATIALVDGLLAVVFDPSCAVCARALERPCQGSVCEACWSAVTPITPPICERCGESLASWLTASVAGGWCARCRRSARGAVDCRRAAGTYEGRLRDILHVWKYGPAVGLTTHLSTLVLTAAGDLCAACDAIVPVPLHRRRRLQRGFNQADDLACALGRPVLRCLRRLRNTPPQLRLTASARRRNVSGAFALAPVTLWSAVTARRARLARTARLESMRAAVRGRHLLLVDDVCTTGATLESCAGVLKAAGAARVSAVTVARALPPRAR